MEKWDMDCTGSLCFASSMLLLLALCPTVNGNSEARVLMEMKMAMDPQNKVLTSWTSGSEHCYSGFLGVSCNNYGEVANISLQGKGLSGKISPAISGLKCLSGIYLHYNFLNGEIPTQISQLTELVDLYLNFNNLSGRIPPQIGAMASLQVLELCYNKLSGEIPSRLGFAAKLNILALQHNRLEGRIPASLGNLVMVKRINLSFNYLVGAIPSTLAENPELEVLDVQNNHLSGYVSLYLKRLHDGFQYGNNLGLCGTGFQSLSNCNSLYAVAANFDSFVAHRNESTNAPKPVAAAIINDRNCHRIHCSSKLPKIAIIAASITSFITFMAILLFFLVRCRLRKQKIGNSYNAASESGGHNKECPPSLVSAQYTNCCDGISIEFLEKYRINLEEIELATRYFSEANLLKKTSFSSIYKGILRDGSVVAIRSLNVSSCKPEEAEFAKGLTLMTSLKHENLIPLRGFCCAKSRGECFLIYDFAANGNLLRFLDVHDGRSRRFLDWPTRVSIIIGIAKGIDYLHKNQTNRPSTVHQNICAEKVLIDDHLSPLISDSGVFNLLADDLIFAALKASAAMGYLAPEYITTGRFTTKSDIYAFGIIILQLLSGKHLISPSIGTVSESRSFLDFMDANLRGMFCEDQAAEIVKIGLICTHQDPDQRPVTQEIILRLTGSKVSHH